MKKILLVGNQSPASIENFYRAGLERIGCRVAIFEPSRYFSNGAIFTKFRLRCGDLSIYRNANHQLLLECERVKPDVVWVFKGIEIVPETIASIKKMGVFVANYNPDHPFIRTSVTSGFQNVADCVPLYDIFFTYNKKLAVIVGEKSFWLPFGYELSVDEYQAISSVEEVRRACFVGTLDSERVTALRFLASRGVAVDVFGPLNRFARRLRNVPKINLYPTIFSKDFWQVLRSYRVQINFFRPHNLGSHNQRTFEVPAAGGILLTPYSDEQSEFFTQGKEIYCYQCLNDLPDAINRITSLSKESVAEVRMAARERTLSSHYSYAARAEFACEILTKYAS